VAVLTEFRRKAEETRELHTSSPGAGEGNCRRFVVIDTSHSDLTVSAVPQDALPFCSLTLIGVFQISNVSESRARRPSHAYRWPTRPHCQDLFLPVRNQRLRLAMRASSLA
jgi:hypothetical protein